MTKSMWAEDDTGPTRRVVGDVEKRGRRSQFGGRGRGLIQISNLVREGGRMKEGGGLVISQL